MNILMNYGKTGLPLELPDEWEITVIRKPPMPVLPEPGVAVTDALENPVGSEPLSSLARKHRKACILICDITRPVPNSLLLPPLIKGLMQGGVRQEDITILVATGLHRPNLGDELAELVGDEWVLRNINIANHYAHNDEDHVYLGDTRLGIPAKIDRRFVEADLRIVTGLVEPHFMAGYSGGRKVITPGIAHADTITRFHSAGLLSHPRVANCMLEGNPLHETQLEIVDMLGGALAVNVVIDERRRLSLINFGDIGQSHLQAVEYLRPYSEVPAGRRFRTVVTSAAGYPLDKTYYQTVKGMVGAADILEPGGNLFIVSECSEGIGSSEYMESQRALIAAGSEGFLNQALSKPAAGIDEWQTRMQLKPMQAGRVHLYSPSLSEEDRMLTGVNVVASPVDAIRQSVQEAGDHRIAVIPEGPYVIPIYRDNSIP